MKIILMLVVCYLIMMFTAALGGAILDNYGSLPIVIAIAILTIVISAFVV